MEVNRMLQNLFLSVWEVSISVSVIAAVFLLLSPFFHKRYAAKWKYRIWIFLALWLAVVPASITFLTNLPALRNAPSGFSSEQGKEQHPYHIFRPRSAGMAVRSSTVSFDPFVYLPAV